MSDRPEDPDPASPACWMHEAGDLYMGFAGRDEILDLLRFLRAAVPAGRAMLDAHIAALGGTAVGIGAACPEAAAPRLRATLPRIRDDRLHADLKALLARIEPGIQAVAFPAVRDFG